MADNVILNSPTTVGATIATDDVGGVQHQLIKVEFGADGVATPVTAAAPLPVTDATAEASLASILAKIIAAPSTEAKQDALNALITTLNSTVSTSAKQDTLIAKDFATQTTLAAILAKIITAPSTEAKQDTIITALNSIDAGTAAALGQALMAASVPVVLASNQTAVPISGTVTVDTSLLSTAAKQDSQTALLTTIDGDTSNLDVALSTRLKAADTLAGVTAVGSITNALPAGTNAIGKLAANDGVDIGDVTVNNAVATPVFVRLSDGAAAIATLPVSAATLPLPALASTSTKQSDGTQKTQIVDSSVNSIDSLSAGVGMRGLMVAIGATNYVVSTVNSSTAQLAAGASFTGTIESIFNQPALSILLTSDQNGTLYIYQYIDAAGVYKADTFTIPITANIPLCQSFALNGNYLNVVFVNNSNATTTTFNLNTAYGTIDSSTNLNNSPSSINEINGFIVDADAGNSSKGTQRVMLANDQPETTADSKRRKILESQYITQQMNLSATQCITERYGCNRGFELR